LAGDTNVSNVNMSGLKLLDPFDTNELEISARQRPTRYSQQRTVTYCDAGHLNSCLSDETAFGVVDSRHLPIIFTYWIILDSGISLILSLNSQSENGFTALSLT
jgi:hypothetical protein